MLHLFTTESLVSLIVLIVLEIVLGIDNVIFVSIIMNRLKKSEDVIKARRLWMFTGILSRSLLLFGLSWLLQQKGKALFSIFNKPFDLASLVMLAGGLFLIYKSVMEIHEKLEGEDPNANKAAKPSITLAMAVSQILLIDAVFSFDSIITAGGTAKHVEIMIFAVVVAMIIMFLFSARISNFIHQHPTLKMLALSFLVMIGLSLVIEGWDSHQAETLHLKNYIYFGMAFSFTVEMLNMMMRNRIQKRRVVQLNEPTMPTEASDSTHS
jgi:predicted tellurium resistance membrane protein TerC